MKAIVKSGLSSGFSLIEVLIAMLVTLVGLLGIAALQARAQQAEMESYQRAQALILLSDIVDRININRATTSCFAITTNTTTGVPFIGVASQSHGRRAELLEAHGEAQHFISPGTLRRTRVEGQ